MSRQLNRPILSQPQAVLGSILAAVVLAVAVLLVAGQMLEIPVEQITGDPAVTFNAHPVTGGISYLGMLFWCAAATICIFSGILLSGDRDARFLLASGAITFMLLVDDLFMFHEAIFPWYFHIPQWAVYAGYGMVILSWLIRFREHLLRTPYRYLVVAVILLACSVAGDFILPQEGGVAYLAEDLFKLFGIVCWFFYFALVGTVRLGEEMAAADAKGETGDAVSAGDDPTKKPAGTAAPAGLN